MGLLSIYFFLSLFPALLFLVALIGYLPVENVLTQLLEALGTIAPSEVLTLLRTQLDEVVRGSYGSLLTLGLVGAIWSSSAAMVAIIDALNHAYDIEERRPCLIGTELNGVIEQAWRMVPGERPDDRRP